MKIRDMILLLLAFICIVWTYQIKHDTENSAKQIKQLRVEIEREEKKIILYQADLAMLTSPNHLAKHLQNPFLKLQLQSPSPEQFITLENLPEKIPAKPIVADPLSSLLEFGETNER